MARKFKVKVRDTLVNRFFARFAKLVKKSPTFYNLNEQEELEKKSIMIGNHNGAGGPFNYRTFMNHRFMTWGAHPMCEGFNSRRKYLYHIFYRQKLGWGKFRAGIMSVLFGSIAGMAYRFAGIIPVYFDSRVFLTYKYSFMCLEQDVSVLVFPEDSSQGYKEKIEKIYAGFIHLSKLYYKKFGVDLPIYTLHYSKTPKQIVIGKPMYYHELCKKFTDDQILQIFIDYMNSLPEIKNQGVESVNPMDIMHSV